MKPPSLEIIIDQHIHSPLGSPRHFSSAQRGEGEINQRYFPLCVALARLRFVANTVVQVHPDEKAAFPPIPITDESPLYPRLHVTVAGRFAEFLSTKVRIARSTSSRGTDGGGGRMEGQV